MGLLWICTVGSQKKGLLSDHWQQHRQEKDNSGSVKILFDHKIQQFLKIIKDKWGIYSICFANSTKDYSWPSLSNCYDNLFGSPNTIQHNRIYLDCPGPWFKSPFTSVICLKYGYPTEEVLSQFNEFLLYISNAFPVL